MDIIIFSGQSNMQGQCECLLNPDRIPNAYEYKFLEDRIVPLTDPAGENITYDRRCGYAPKSSGDLGKWLSNHVAGSSCDNSTNLVAEFCSEYTKITENAVLAVHIAKGSTDISYWLPGSEGYKIIADKAGAAIERVKKLQCTGRIFFVWLQGESDAILGKTKSYYKEKLHELCTALISELRIEKFGIIRVGRFTEDARDLEIISAQNEICTENKDFLMLTDIATQLNTQKEYMNPFVHGHYSAKGLNKLGHEAGKCLGTYAKGNKV